jgi:hypothetical protein
MNVDIEELESCFDQIIKSGDIADLEQVCDQGEFSKPTTGNVYHWRVVKSGSRWHLIEDHETNGTEDRGYRCSFRTLKESNRMALLLAKMFHYGWGMTVNVTRERPTKRGMQFDVKTFCYYRLPS